jgi:transposase
MCFSYFIGIDVSKLTIDLAIYVSANAPILHQQFENRPSGFRKLLRWVHSSCGKSELLFCLEHTGIYALPLCCFMEEQQLNYSLQSALQVKKSMGIQRGKSDKADAKLLARYAYLYREEIQLSHLPTQTLSKIQHLLAYRQRLVKSKVALEVAAKELAAFVDKDFSSGVIKDSQKHIHRLQESITSLDKQLQQIIQADCEVKRVYQLVTSVAGVGLQTAAHLMLATHCFTNFDNWRQLVPAGIRCYVGTAPFEHSSGSSVRGKTRLSKVGDMKLKALLSNGATSVIQSENEFSVYYHRKIAEGKAKLVALNGVRNKILSRVFSVVKRGTPYIPDSEQYLKLVS